MNERRLSTLVYILILVLIIALFYAIGQASGQEAEATPTPPISDEMTCKEVKWGEDPMWYFCCKMFQLACGDGIEPTVSATPAPLPTIDWRPTSAPTEAPDCPDGWVDIDGKCFEKEEDDGDTCPGGIIIKNSEGDYACYYPEPTLTTPPQPEITPTPNNPYPPPETPAIPWSTSTPRPYPAPEVADTKIENHGIIEKAIEVVNSFAATSRNNFVQTFERIVKTFN